MAIGAEIPPAHPASIGTIWVRAEVHRGIDLTASPSRGHEAGWQRCGGVRVGGGGMLTDVAVRLCGETLKRCEVAVALAPGWRQCGWHRPYGSPVTGPRVMEQEAQP